MSSDEHFSLRLSDSDAENQTFQKNDDAKRTQGSPQEELSTEIFESEEPEVIRLERSVRNLPTIKNKVYLADNVCKNISEIGNVDSRNDQLNSNSNSSKLSDSSVELLGFNNSLHSVCQKVAGNERQVLKKTVTTSSGKNLSTNRNYVPSNFELTEEEEENIFEINNNSQSRYSLRPNRVKDFSPYLSNSEISSDSSEKSLGSSKKSSNSSKKSRDANQESLVSSEESSHYSTELLGFQKPFHTDQISYSKKNDDKKVKHFTSYFSNSETSSDSSEKSLGSSKKSSDSSKKSPDANQESLVSSEELSHSFTDSHSKKNDDKNIPSSSSSDSSTEFLGFKTTCPQRNLSTKQNNVSSDFERIRKKRKDISWSSDSSIELSGIVKITSTPKNPILKRRRYCEPSSSDESDDSSPNDRKRFIVRRSQKNKHRKFIRSSSSSDSEDIVFIRRKLSKSSSRSKNKSSSDKNYTSSVNTAKSDIKVSRRRKEAKIKKLRKYFLNVNVDLRRQKYFWRECQLNVDKVLKWIQNKKNINNLIEDPRALQREIEVYLEHLELNTRSIISLNKRVTRSQTAAQRWQHFLKYGKAEKRWPF